MSDYCGSSYHKKNILAAKALATARQAELKLQRIEEYNKNPILCECCGSPLSYESKIKRKRFCNSSCAAKVTNVIRGPRSQETRTKMSQAQLSLQRKRHRSGSSTGFNPQARLCVCRVCGVQYSSLRITAKNDKACSDECKQRWRSSEEYRQSQRENAKRRVAEGKHVGWKSRLGKAPSYPERYFIDLFTNEGIYFEREVKCGKFFIDFVVGNYAIEVDGGQHEYPDHVERDTRKDEFLTENGYIVFRIKWANPSTATGKAKLYPQIEELKRLLTRSKMGDEVEVVT